MTGRVLRCPACGQAHSFDGLSENPTFPCSECGRTLRTPTELVAPASTDRRRISDSGSPDAPEPESPGSQAAGASAKRPAKARSNAVPIPVRIAVWLGAIVVGLVLGWLVASGTGLLSRSIFVDMFRSSTATNYWRLALFVPLWAFMSATFATVLIEGIRWFRARRAGEPGPRRQGSDPDPGAPEPKRPALSRSVPDVDSSPVAPRRPSTPPGQRTRIRPSGTSS